MTSVAVGDKLVLFGGQDSQQERLYNELYVLDTKSNELKLHEYKEGKVKPFARNSHTLTKLDDKKAYLFGGANEDGPLKDLFELDLETL